MRRRAIYAALVFAGTTQINAPLLAQLPDRFFEPRQKMVAEAIAREGIKNAAVLNAMRKVPRHLFVSPQYRVGAYFDQALPIGHKQTISPPFIVAYMTEMLDPRPEDKVLEIGTGSGYQAAVLSELVKEVYTIEIVEPLGKSAAKLLTDLNCSNVHTRIGDGYQGWAEHAPFDKIIVTCSPESVPQPLVEQLREGGRMIVPLGERYEQVFYLFEKKDGELKRQRLLPTLFVPMTGISEANRQVQPDPAHPALHNGSFEADENKDGQPDAWHYQRQLTLATNNAPDGAKYAVFENHDPGRWAMALQGLAVDGAKVAALQITVYVKADALRSGAGPSETPGLNVQFYDSDRKPLEGPSIGPWFGTFDWKTESKQVRVPSKAREAIVRVGINGGTGRLCVDNIQMQAVPR